MAEQLSSYISAATPPRDGALRLALRLRGGGGDGGVYPLTHAEMQWMTPSGVGGGGKAWTHQWADKIGEETRRLDKACNCAASDKPLKPPIVVTDLGSLCNKEDLIEGLLSKTLPPDLEHVKSLKDFSTATLHSNPHFTGEDLKGGFADGAFNDVPYRCPIADLPFNGRFPFVFLRTSGQIVSERAFKQLGGKKCPVTEHLVEEEDIVPLNGDEEQRESLAVRAASRKAALKEAAKKKKAKEKAAAAAAVGTAQPTGSGAGPSSAVAMEPASSSGAGPSSAVATESASSSSAAAPKAALASSVLKGASGEQAEATGGTSSRVRATGSKRKAEWEEVVKAKSSSSAVYKSLFVSKEDRERELAQGNNNFCARGIPMALSRSTKFTM